MKILVQIFVTFLLLFWPMVLLTSVMMFDAPGSTENISNIATVIGVIFYPVIIGLILYVLDFSLWTISPKNVLIGTILVPLAGALLMGYPTMLLARLKGLPTQGYFVKENVVYFAGKKIDAEATSFKIIQSDDKPRPIDDFASDKNKVFYRGRILDGADPGTFRSIDRNQTYHADKNHVYYRGKLLIDADSASFESLKDASEKEVYLHRDKNFVYFNGQRIDKIRGSEAKMINTNYVADHSGVAYVNKYIEGADLTSFKVYQDFKEYASDANSVYFRGQPIQGADPKSFQPLENYYSKDVNYVYYVQNSNPEPIKDADPKTFEVTEYDRSTASHAKDHKNYYLNGVKSNP